MDLDRCFYDYAVDYYAQDRGVGYSILWKAESASQFASLCVGGTKAKRHHWCMLPGIAGASAVRAKPRGKRRDDCVGPLFTQLYHGDKPVFSNFTGGGVNGYSPAQVLTTNGKYQKSVLSMGNTLFSTSSNRYAARVEYRVNHSYFTDNWELLYQKADLLMKDCYKIPTSVCNSYKSFLLAGWNSLSSVVVKKFQSKENQILLAQYIHMNTVAVTKAPDPVKFKYCFKVFEDLESSAETFGRFVTSQINFESGVIYYNPVNMTEAINIFQKHFRKFQFGTYSSQKKESQNHQAEPTRDDEEIEIDVEVEEENTEILVTDTPEDVMNLCLRNIWNNMPVTHIDGLDLRTPMDINENNFQGNSCVRLIFGRVPWGDKFASYFPINDQNLQTIIEKQGGQNLSYLPEFKNWWQAQTPETQEEFRILFGKVKVLPNSNTKKLFYYVQGMLILVKNNSAS
jgi:hypothetical protein